MPEPSVTQPPPQPQGSDYETVQAMRRYGSSFARALAEAMHHADQEYLARIKTAFPELMAEFAEMARLHAEHGKR